MAFWRSPVLYRLQQLNYRAAQVSRYWQKMGYKDTPSEQRMLVSMLSFRYLADQLLRGDKKILWKDQPRLKTT